MPDEALQTAFEIKTTCDEISRKLLRWHWENKPGEHSLGALLDHIRTRQQESPEYYDRLPDLAGRNSWQQLDTTLCMRVLLDPEKDAAHQLDLLSNTEHPAAARRACNAVRTARNEAAHASDRTAAAQAAILFNEAVEALEEGYAGAPLRTSELGQYYPGGGCALGGVRHLCAGRCALCSADAQGAGHRGTGRGTIQLLPHQHPGGGACRCPCGAQPGGGINNACKETLYRVILPHHSGSNGMGKTLRSGTHPRAAHSAAPGALCRVRPCVADAARGLAAVAEPHRPRCL